MINRLANFRFSTSLRVGLQPEHESEEKVGFSEGDYLQNVILSTLLDGGRRVAQGKKRQEQPARLPTRFF